MQTLRRMDEMPSALAQEVRVESPRGIYGGRADDNRPLERARTRPNHSQHPRKQAKEVLESCLHRGEDAPAIALDLLGGLSAPCFLGVLKTTVELTS